MRQLTNAFCKCRVAEYVTNAFKGTNIKVEVVKGHDTLKKEYPCFAAVDRCANTVPRHQGCVIWLTYEPEGPVNQTVMMVGKGVTYDTGGADIKAGGIMAGMSRYCPYFSIRTSIIGL